MTYKTITQKTKHTILYLFSPAYRKQEKERILAAKAKTKEEVDKLFNSIFNPYGVNDSDKLPEPDKFKDIFGNRNITP